MTLPELQQAVAYLFPSAVYGTTWTASVDSSGNATINLWSNSIGAQPDSTALSTALVESQLAAAKTTQNATLVVSYNAARYGTPVSITVGSTTMTFPTDTLTQANVTGYLVAFSASTAPASMPLVDATGTTQSLTYAAMQSLAEAIGNASIAAWTKLKTLQADVTAATTIADVQAVVW